ncbi:uncharacterized protein LOC131680673 [Topomyia yanbarensis]|uniref:uncharacterized protein LOC131680673 n=1 Tax=Topomyia yanbarensis TaxID=2498891 RepID=UPI00273B2607|nr:uncharacterized protein LOC131680673 [Topomyia yanbarensis]
MPSKKVGNKSAKIPPPTNVSCNLCNSPDNSRMVQCDDCNKWYHYSCVHVDEGIANYDCCCDECVTKKSQPAGTSTPVSSNGQELAVTIVDESLTVAPTTKATNVGDNALSATGATGPTLQCTDNSDNAKLRQEIEKLRCMFQTQRTNFEHQINMLEEQKNTSMNERIYKLQAQWSMRENQLQKEIALLKRKPDNVAIETKSQSETKSIVSSKRTTKDRERRLIALKERQALEMRHLEEQLVLMEECSSEYEFANEEEENISCKEKVDKWLENGPHPDTSIAPTPVCSDVLSVTSKRNTNSNRSTTGNYSQHARALSKNQLAARQAVSKDLPTFSGDPEDWPLFFATFESSTAMCGYTNEENIFRLRRCLKDKAFDATRSLLLHPDNVGTVMSTLKTLFGRPNLIVGAMIQKIRDIPPPRIEKLNTMINFGVSVQNLCATIQACELDEYYYNVTILQELEEKLPPTVKLSWALTRKPIRRVKLTDFNEWLKTIVEAACEVTTPDVDIVGKTEKKKNQGFLNVHSVCLSESPREPATDDCIVCKSDCETVAKCKRFLSMNVDMRWKVLRACKLCRRCLRKHFTSCDVKDPCGQNGCTFLHHKLLHNDTKHRDARLAPPSPPTDLNQCCNIHRSGVGSVFFRYVPVIIKGKGKSIVTFAFLDDGSSSTLMEQELYNELGLEGTPQPLCLNWTGGTSRWEKNSVKLSVDISSVHSPDKQYRLSGVHTVAELRLPEQTLSIEDLSQRYKHLEGLPIQSYSRIAPRILIGMNNCRLGHVLDSREGRDNEPSAAKTRLGWIVYGPCFSSSQPNTIIDHAVHRSYHICACNKGHDEDLHAAVKEYFALDSMGIISPRKILQSKEDERAIRLLEQCTTLKNGRHESGLLWKYNDVRLPNSRSMALTRTKCLEKRMEREPELASMLKSKISEYEEKGYVRKLTSTELKIHRNRVWYLPVFPVVNPNKPGKIRIVWDAAAEVRGISLNSQLLKGPDLLNSLVSVLYKFREYKIAITADIREMFHQVRMNENDQHCQRFFWPAEEPGGKPHEYIMTVLSFGATCSPATNEYCMNLNAQRFAKEFPRAVEAITKQHYVDDMLTSVEEVEQAVKLAKEVRHIHSHAGFEIRNWHSNSDHLLNKLDAKPHVETSLSIDSETAIEILGMWWDTKTDCFTFKLSPRHDGDLLSGRKIPTKRELLRTLMTIFDPLGLIANLLMYLKVLLQEVWRSGVGWDEKISGNLLDKWRVWLRVLPGVQSVAVPRCYRKHTSASDETTTIELHTFVDASESGYAAVSYFRFEEGDEIECAIAGAKTRVAPLKFVTIPRLELQAAVLGARLAKSIVEHHKRPIVKRYFYTDSKDVMHWINSDHRRYSQFVAARVSEILESTTTTEWYWISTKLNVADEGTKWQKLPDLSPNSRWFRSPEFLWTNKINWPTHCNSFGSTDEELRPTVLHHNAYASIIAWERFSKWNRLLRSAAWVQRYVSNLQRQSRSEGLQYGPLSHEELKRAEMCIYRLAQKEMFPKDYSLASHPIKANTQKRLKEKGQLSKRHPIMDESQVLRIPGRIDECNFVGDLAKRPIFLPRQHYITTLIIREVHKLYHHQNHQTVLNELKQKYYIPKVRTQCDRVRRNCQFCKIRNTTPQPPMMGSLPAARLAAYARTFSYIGIDYFGPQEVLVGRRVEKRWGVLITCLTVLRHTH